MKYGQFDIQCILCFSYGLSIFVQVGPKNMTQTLYLDVDCSAILNNTQKNEIILKMMSML